MTTYSVRCRVDACRHRRVIRKHPDEYKRVTRCPVCGSKNGWRIENRTYNKRNLCKCDGPSMCKGQYFPHNKTHPMCDHHPKGFYNQAKRAGIEDYDIPVEYGGTMRHIKPEDYTPEQANSELLELVIKAGRRCAYDLQHASDDIPGNQGGILRDRADMWLRIFDPAHGPKDYRSRLHTTITELEMRVQGLLELCHKVGIDCGKFDDPPF